MKTEEWRDVKGYEGSYQVSSEGRVFSLKSGRELNAGDSMGYPNVNLLKGGKQRSCKVHRLVAEAFIPNPLGMRTVNHIDGVKTNNAIENLEWATYSGNNNHAYKYGLKRQAAAVCSLNPASGFGEWFYSAAEAVRNGAGSLTGITRASTQAGRLYRGRLWLRTALNKSRDMETKTEDDA